ncbi:MAG: class I SAM-dependent methyltransferase [Alphaproteobacteria bacterium]|nr:class I SAM-dependent methyltransferase [Alphaproteobacteria bacterium]MBU0798061.1 class I SAM-dependent methyltransferase [Alphaproteobacteria bacterium]MBU0888761.1 class I SAM-dependent methyltransferase [Alphaproteobacteria bacterium]MBU1812520.1 class I SAM-dependent methyltransferase [Alphaproteobacteria bacterium]
MSGGARWSRYYESTQGRPPRDTLLFALDRFAAEGMPDLPSALDLGCGDGRDTVELLRRSWRVLAMDSTPEAFERMAARPDLPATGTLETRVARFEDFQPPEADFINASFSLPFCEKPAFPGLWQRLAGALRPNGRFAGQFLGPQDDWAASGIVIHERKDVEALFPGFALERLDEVIEQGTAPMAPSLANGKRWHIFHVVAKKLMPGK